MLWWEFSDAWENRAREEHGDFDGVLAACLGSGLGLAFGVFESTSLTVSSGDSGLRSSGFQWRTNATAPTARLLRCLLKQQPISDFPNCLKHTHYELSHRFHASQMEEAREKGEINGETLVGGGKWAWQPSCSVLSSCRWWGDCFKWREKTAGSFPAPLRAQMQAAPGDAACFYGTKLMGPHTDFPFLRIWVRGFCIVASTVTNVRTKT
jgi:hypothetical protein